jgi:hypothetical protein
VIPARRIATATARWTTLGCMCHRTMKSSSGNVSWPSARAVNSLARMITRAAGKGHCHESEVDAVGYFRWSAAGRATTMRPEATSRAWSSRTLPSCTAMGAATLSDRTGHPILRTLLLPNGHDSLSDVDVLDAERQAFAGAEPGAGGTVLSRAESLIWTFSSQFASANRHWRSPWPMHPSPRAAGLPSCVTATACKSRCIRRPGRRRSSHR